MSELDEIMRRSDEIADRIGMDRDEFFCRLWSGDEKLLPLLKQTARTTTDESESRGRAEGGQA